MFMNTLCVNFHQGLLCMLTIKYIFISCPAVTCLLNKILFSYRDLPLLFIYDSVTV